MWLCVIIFNLWSIFLRMYLRYLLLFRFNLTQIISYHCAPLHNLLHLNNLPLFLFLFSFPNYYSYLLVELIPGFWVGWIQGPRLHFFSKWQIQLPLPFLLIKEGTLRYNFISFVMLLQTILHCTTTCHNIPHYHYRTHCHNTTHSHTDMSSS